MLFVLFLVVLWGIGMGCPALFLAGADAALRVALGLGVRPLNWLLSAGRYWRGGGFVYSSDFRLARSLGACYSSTPVLSSSTPDSGAPAIHSHPGSI
jgi:hypothetical protein